MLEVLKFKPSVPKYLGEKLKGDLNFILKIVKNDQSMMKYLSSKMKKLIGKRLEEEFALDCYQMKLTFNEITSSLKLNTEKMPWEDSDVANMLSIVNG